MQAHGTGGRSRHWWTHTAQADAYSTRTGGTLHWRMCMAIDGGAKRERESQQHNFIWAGAESLLTFTMEVGGRVDWQTCWRVLMWLHVLSGEGALKVVACRQTEM